MPSRPWRSENDQEIGKGRKWLTRPSNASTDDPIGNANLRILPWTLLCFVCCSPVSLALPALSVVLRVCLQGFRWVYFAFWWQQGSPQGSWAAVNLDCHESQTWMHRECVKECMQGRPGCLINFDWKIHSTNGGSRTYGAKCWFTAKHYGPVHLYIYYGF